MNRDILNTLLIEYRQKREAAENAAKNISADLISSDADLLALYDSQAELFFALGSAELLCKKDEAKDIEKKIDVLEQKITELQNKKNIDPSSIKPKYECTICDDTGYIGQTMCTCLKQRYIEALVKHSGMKETGESFESFNEEIIPDIKIGKLSQRQLTIKIKNYCKDFAETFPNTKKQNILLMGKTGLGKSFMLNSVAKVVLENRYTVLKTTAYNMIDRLLTSFKNPEISSDKEQFFNVDLLIIDDLGSEPFIKNVTAEHLFSIINERTANNMHTLYSTNLGLIELQERYGDRIFSRLTDQKSTYILELKGEDLRHKL